MIKHSKAYVQPHCEYAQWLEEHLLCSSENVEMEDFNGLTDYEW